MSEFTRPQQMALDFSTPAIPNRSGICLCGCGNVTPRAPFTSAARQWVKGEHIRYIKGHRKGRTVEQRFWAHVIRQDGCWAWRGATSNGYGQLRVNGHNVSASRISWKIHHEFIPKGFFVLHCCDNPPCTNPDHLFLGTVADNSQDMVRKGRHIMQTHPERAKRFEAHPGAILTQERVRAIRANFMPHVVTRKALASLHGVSESTIKDVLAGRYWRGV